MSQEKLQELALSLYVAFLEAHSLKNPSPAIQEILTDITLATVLENESSPSDTNPSRPDVDRGTLESCPFQVDELHIYGTPTRHHLNASTRQTLLEAVYSTLQSMSDFLRGGTGAPQKDDLMQDLWALKAAITTNEIQLGHALSHINKLTDEAKQIKERFQKELSRLLSTTFPAYDASRVASVEIIAATIEASLIKLSFIQLQAERILYNHRSKKTPDGTHRLTEAMGVASAALRREENEMKNEIQSLDRQLKEYESLLQLVDGGTGGYQQVVDDWTKVKQETDECKKDLRRLGWTGD